MGGIRIRRVAESTTIVREEVLRVEGEVGCVGEDCDGEEDDEGSGEGEADEDGEGGDDGGEDEGDEKEDGEVSGHNSNHADNLITTKHNPSPPPRGPPSPQQTILHFQNTRHATLHNITVTQKTAKGTSSQYGEILDIADLSDDSDDEVRGDDYVSGEQDPPFRSTQIVAHFRNTNHEYFPSVTVTPKTAEETSSQSGEILDIADLFDLSDNPNDPFYENIPLSENIPPQKQQ